MHTQYQDYKDGDLTCEAYIATDENKKGKRPAVLVSHAWGGQSDFERGKAENTGSEHREMVEIVEGRAFHHVHVAMRLQHRRQTTA